MIDIWNLRSRSRDQIDIGSSIHALAEHPSQEVAAGTSDEIAMLRLEDDRASQDQRTASACREASGRA
jgi:hypothetical protein